MKKILVMSISLLLVFVLLGLCINIETIDNYLTVFEYEISYNKSKDTVDLIDLCFRLTQKTNNHFLDDKRTKYLKELIDVISIEDVEKSEMSKQYSEVSSDISPKEFAILLYVVHLLSSQEYELFVDEFSVYYLQVDYETDIILQQSIQVLYSKTSEPLIIEYGKKAYEKIISDTNDEITKEICKVQIDVLEQLNNTAIRGRKQSGDGSVIDG